MIQLLFTSDIMDISFSLFLIVGFVAVVLLLEGGFVYWNDTQSPEVRRVAQRLRAISAWRNCSSSGC